MGRTYRRADRRTWKAWDEINTSDMTALEAIIDYIADVGLEGIGMDTTEENIKKLNADNFRDIIAGWEEKHKEK